MNKNALPSFLAAVTLSAALAISACSTTSTGMGGGDLRISGQQNTPVLFSWQSTDGGISGSMVATLPDTTYQGHFVQITHETSGDTISTIWGGWNVGWTDWPSTMQHWPTAYDAPTFSRDYSGRVLANLQNPGGLAMRCRFLLNAPSKGMGGGGQGECQMTSGGQITATINQKG